MHAEYPNPAATTTTSRNDAAPAAQPSPVVAPPLRPPMAMRSYRLHDPALDDCIGGCTLATMLCLVSMLIVDGFARGLVA